MRTIELEEVVLVDEVKDKVDEVLTDEVDEATEVDTVVLAHAAGAEPMPTVNGCTSTCAKLIQLVTVKKLPRRNCATVVSVSCCEKLARLQMLAPGP